MCPQIFSLQTKVGEWPPNHISSTICVRVIFPLKGTDWLRQRLIIRETPSRRTIFFLSYEKIFFTPQVPVPKPVLSGVSMITDKNQTTKALAKKSFTKWKQQHDALFERKHIETKSQTMAFLKQRKGTYAFDSSADASAKFDLDFKKLVPSQIETTDEYQQFDHGCNNGINFSASNLTRPQFQGMMAFSQLNRKLRSEATGFTVSPLAEQHDTTPTEESQSNSCSCRCIDVASKPDPKSDFEGRGSQSSLQIVEDLTMDKLVQSKRQPTSKLLANIVEEQIEIVEQQKQILKQQNEIFNLQYRIEKALLLNGSSSGGITNALPHKQMRRIAAAASPNVESNALSPIGNGTAFKNCPDRSPNGRNSIGVMTSLSEICSPPTENGSPKDTMLERINKIIENSPPMISYKQTNGNKNCRISPLRSDVNISSKT